MASQQAAQLERLSVGIEAPVARVALHNPPLNVLDFPLLAELASALAEIEARCDISVVVLSGEGKNFSAGVDVAAHTPDKVAAMLSGFHGIIRTLTSSKKVTVASVQGHCLGGGAELAMVCDLVYSSEDARWGFPEIQLGCFPPVAVTALSALVGQKRAADLILTGRSINGSEAARIGIATGEFPLSQLCNAVDETVEKLSKLSPAALALTKKSTYAWDSMHFDKGLARAEKIYLDELMQTQDAQEGIRAFLEKRHPEWKGR